MEAKKKKKRRIPFNSLLPPSRGLVGGYFVKAFFDFCNYSRLILERGFAFFHEFSVVPVSRYTILERVDFQAQFMNWEKMPRNFNRRLISFETNIYCRINPTFLLK